MRETDSVAAKRRNGATEVGAVAKPGPVTARRDLRRQRLRQELVTAAMQLFRERGYDAVTVNDVTDAIGISRRTFFRYFTSKEDLAFDWMMEQGEFMAEFLQTRSADETPFDAMKATMLEVAKLHDRRPDSAYFRTKLIFETPALNGRFHLEEAQWLGIHSKALLDKRGSAVRSAHDALQVRVQITMAAAAFVVAIRCWLESGAKSALYPWAVAAFEEPRTPRRRTRQG